MKAAASLSSSMQSISLAPAASGCVSNLLDLPPEMLGEILLRLADARSLAAVACTCHALAVEASRDAPWSVALEAALPGVDALLTAAPPPWLRSAPTARARLAALAGGLPFKAQVFHREASNPVEDFWASAYDATLTLATATTAPDGAGPPPPLPPSLPASRRPPSSSSKAAAVAAAPAASRGRGGPGAPPPAAPAPRRSGLPRPGEAAVFTATYLPMGGAAATETEVTLARLRAAPREEEPEPAAAAGGAAAAAAAAPTPPHPDWLVPAAPVEVQWKAAKGHPYGWWLGVVEGVHGDPSSSAPATVDVAFDQYPPDSPWKTVAVPVAPLTARAGGADGGGGGSRPGKRARRAVVARPVNGDPECAYGYVGALRRPSPADLAAWDASLTAVEAAGGAGGEGRPRPVRALKGKAAAV